ncbi:MAG: hypothetical protein MUF24_05595 [Chitinophagaceae bacterium]|nr:hypothetical protein [Chitinophagaceae bacterium]
MDAFEILLDCFAFYKIPVSHTNGNMVYTIKSYSIEVEKNGLYKLMQNNEVIAPFDDINELSQFILQY